MDPLPSKKVVAVGGGDFEKIVLKGEQRALSARHARATEEFLLFQPVIDRAPVQ